MEQKEQQVQAKKIDRSPVWNGLGASAVIGGFIAWAVAKETGGLPNVAVSFAVIGVGLAVTLFSVLRLKALLVGVAVGLSIGAVSASQILTQAVADPLLPIAASFVFFLTLGFILGGMVEFIFFLHHLSHGGSPSEYPSEPTVIASETTTGSERSLGKQSRR